MAGQLARRIWEPPPLRFPSVEMNYFEAATEGEEIKRAEMFKTKWEQMGASQAQTSCGWTRWSG